MNLLVIDGAVESSLALSFEDLRDMDEEDQVRDVSRLHPGRRGDGVRFAALLRRARPVEGANYLTLHAERDGFRVSVPLEPVVEQAVVVYALEGRPLGPEQHGPYRFLIPDPMVCRTGELDECANVKYLDRIEITLKKGVDTRPKTEEEHAALHARQEAGS
ncbi:MAG: hypothetical protein KatS3mg108_1435 [Isosphaeraceae bacterium]|jgi:DMSO/TMAO reductase YedYZ molybdopterin-dependent catalytic subunit|nr:MAG: hypothetical protein KatS3mg108_1435 [Isosphaeraceae bacterium]